MKQTPLKVAANLSWLYNEHPFLDRFDAAAQDGFAGIECLFPHEHSRQDIQARLKNNALRMVLFNAAPGDWHAGDRGLACRSGQEQAFRRSIMAALDLAQALQCPRVHVMAGLSEGLRRGDAALLTSEWACYEARLRWALELASTANVTLMIEPINPIDMPDYLLQTQADAHTLVSRIGSPYLQVQMDLYHCQRVEGNALALLDTYLPTGRVGHLQIAGVPSRHEPDVGSLDCPAIFQTLLRLNYEGWVGAEYRPQDNTAGGTHRGLRWMPR